MCRVTSSGDPNRLRQLVVNLVSNAVKFTSTGQIVVQVAVDRETNGGVVLNFAVEDSGIGIAADKIDTVFEAFRQSDSSTTRRFGGTGLGLTISRQLVELMEWRNLAGKRTRRRQHVPAHAALHARAARHVRQHLPPSDTTRCHSVQIRTPRSQAGLRRHAQTLRLRRDRDGGSRHGA